MLNRQIPENLLLPRSPGLDLIEGAVGSLLPHAAYNVGMPFNTPLRGAESQMRNESEPFSFGLWINLTPHLGPKPGYDKERSIAIYRTLQSDTQNKDRVWACSVTEPTPADDKDTTYYVTSMGVNDMGYVTAQQSFYKTVPSERPNALGIRVGGEFEFQVSKERRDELIGHIRAVLTQATIQSPIDQERYLQAWHVDASSRRFTLLGSNASRIALNLIVNHPLERHLWAHAADAIDTPYCSNNVDGS